jgi:hypothetical protein
MKMDGRDDLGQEIAREISHTIAQKIAIGIALFFAFVLFIVFGGIAVQLLWNWLVPDILNLRRITFWEALGLLALCRILFGGFGRGSGSHTDGRDRRQRKEWWKPSKPAATSGPSAPAPTAAVPAE